MRFLAGLFAITAILDAAQPALEQVLSVPYTSNLVTNGRGKIAWVQNLSGVRNVWVAEAPAYQGHALTNYAEDDGMEISDLSISQDGSAVVYTRGDGANGQGEFPNPRHLVAGVDQTIMELPFAGGAPKQLGRGHGAAISSDNSTVAFVSGKQIWAVPLSGASAAVQVTHNRGEARGLTWSPDGKSLAFTSYRALHSFIAIYNVGNSSLRFLDASSDFDANPVWSQDSKRVAFTRVPSTYDSEMHKPRRSAETPWSIRLADAQTGVGEEVWKALPGAGSVFQEIVGEHQILWAAGNRIVFPWERTSWLHLYSIAVDGGGLVDLMNAQPGAEIEDVALSPDRSSVVFSSNWNDIDRRHVYQVGVDAKSTPQPIGRRSIEWGPVMATGQEVALIHGDAGQPGRVAVVRGELHEVTPDARGQAPTGTPPVPVTFPAADGLPLHGQLFLPKDGQAKHPAVVFLHGGSRRQMLLGWHYMFYYHQAYGFNQYLASRGYVVLSVNYRSGVGYGLNFREALDYGPSGGSEFNDVLGAGLYLRAREDVLPGRIGLWGGSYGGYLTALGLARASDLFAAGVDLHGVHNWNDEMEDAIPQDQPEKRLELARVALQSSPLAYMSTWKSPVLLIQGDDDRNVGFRQTEILAEALRKQHVPFEELIFPDEIHDFLTHDHWLKAYHAAEAFLDKYLRPAMKQ